MKTRNIVLYTTTVLEHGGGHESSFSKIAKTLASDKNNIVTVATMDENFSNKLGKILNFYYLKKVTDAPLKRETKAFVTSEIGKACYVKCKNFRELRNIIIDSDIVYSKNELLESVILKFFIKKSNIKFLSFDCATCLYYPSPKTIQAKIHNFLYTGFMYKYLAGMVDQFMVKNSFEHEKYQNMFKHADVRLYYNSFDFNKIRLESNVDASLLKDSADKKNILWLGRLTEQKGIDDLVSSIRLANEMGHIDWNWHIVGDGDEKPKIEALEKAVGNVHYYGHVANTDTAKMYSLADVYLSTSDWESFGNTIVEAIAQNTPSVVRRIPGPSDIVVDGVNGKFANSPKEYVESIRLILNSLEKYRDIRHTVVDRFSDNKVESIQKLLLDAR